MDLLWLVPSAHHDALVLRSRRPLESLWSRVDTQVTNLSVVGKLVHSGAVQRSQYLLIEDVGGDVGAFTEHRSREFSTQQCRPFVGVGGVAPSVGVPGCLVVVLVVALGVLVDEPNEHSKVVTKQSSHSFVEVLPLVGDVVVPGGDHSSISPRNHAIDNALAPTKNRLAETGRSVNDFFTLSPEKDFNLQRVEVSVWITIHPRSASKVNKKKLANSRDP